MNDILLKALEFYGEKEILGKKTNPVITMWFHEMGFLQIKNDETPNCSAFVNYCAKVTGYIYSGDLLARSWLNVGNVITDPLPGCIVVFWRKNKKSIWGHVGFFISKKNNLIYTLGANQNDMVCIKPYTESKVLGYRKLIKVKVVE